jgi:hypothetical protein
MNEEKLRSVEKRAELIPTGDLDEVERLTIRNVFVETYFNERGERCEREMPASYDESTPFPPPRFNQTTGRWTSVRILNPIEPDQAWLGAGPYSSSVPKTPTPEARKDGEDKG